MIFKEADDKDAAINDLEELLAYATRDKRTLIERELRNVRAGIKGEKEAAYLIDFHMRESRKTAVIHDLRLELADGRVAQIDHLLIHWTCQFFALETKHFSHGVKITETGEFLRWDGWKKNFDGMPSPLEQGERHALVLRKALTDIGIADPSVESVVLIDPKARIDRPKKFNTSRVVKADQFIHALQDTLDKRPLLTLVSGFIKTRFTKPIDEIARDLVALHRPAKIDYAARFGIERKAPSQPAIVARAESPQVAVLQAAVPQAEGTQLDMAQDAEVPACRACNGHDLSIQYGKFGYYFKCRSCDGNTPIAIGCGKPNHRERIRKQGDLFFRECHTCGSSALYFRNPPPSP